jgi:hypothetical protein
MLGPRFREDERKSKLPVALRPIFPCHFFDARVITMMNAEEKIRPDFAG